MNSGAVVTFSGVTPVEDEHAAVRSVAEVEAAEPGVGREEAVGLVTPHIAAAGAFEPFDVDATAMEVEGEQFAADRLRATGRPGRSWRRYGRVLRLGGRAPP